jgi:hypothetical protein
MMMAIIASIGANGVCAGRIDIRQPHVIAAAGLVMEVMLVHAWRAPVQGQKGRWDSLEVDHRLEGAG